MPNATIKLYVLTKEQRQKFITINIEVPLFETKCYDYGSTSFKAWPIKQVEDWFYEIDKSAIMLEHEIDILIDWRVLNYREIEKKQVKRHKSNPRYNKAVLAFIHDYGDVTNDVLAVYALIFEEVKHLSAKAQIAAISASIKTTGVAFQEVREILSTIPQLKIQADNEEHELPSRPRPAHRV